MFEVVVYGSGMFLPSGRGRSFNFTYILLMTFFAGDEVDNIFSFTIRTVCVMVLSDFFFGDSGFKVFPVIDTRTVPTVKIVTTISEKGDRSLDGTAIWWIIDLCLA